MKNKKSLKKAFGINEFGMINFPVKISNIRVSRILSGKARGCSFCFPHGYETNNSKYLKYQRCWKKYRKNQFK